MQRGDPVSIVSVSEPVYVIPTEEIPPGQNHNSGGSSRTTNDGITVTTTYNNRRSVVRRKVSPSIIAASEPVYVIPNDGAPTDRRLSGTNGSDTATTTDDGTTLTTTYTTGQGRNLLQTNPNSAGSVNIINTKNQSLALSDVNKGLNCEGSFVMCIGAAQWGVMHTLRDYMYAIPDGYRYYAGQDIACMKHHVYPNPVVTWGFYCALMQGNIPAEGVDGAELLLKMQQMIEHHCLGCGSVPFSSDNDPNILGILTVNYVSQSECEGLCYYRPPGIAANAAVTVPKGMTLAS